MPASKPAQLPVGNKKAGSPCKPPGVGFVWIEPGLRHDPCLRPTADWTWRQPPHQVIVPIAPLTGVTLARGLSFQKRNAPRSRRSRRGWIGARSKGSGWYGRWVGVLRHEAGRCSRWGNASRTGPRLGAAEDCDPGTSRSRSPGRAQRSTNGRHMPSSLAVGAVRGRWDSGAPPLGPERRLDLGSSPASPVPPDTLSSIPTNCARRE